MNKFLRITIVVLIIFSLSGCTNGSSDAQADFEEIMNTFKTCDEKAIDEVYGFTELSSFIDKTSGIELRDAVISTLSKMDYKVISAERISSTAVSLDVEITTIDFSNVIESYISKIITLVDSREYKAQISSMEDDKYKSLMSDKMIESINESGDIKVTNTIEVTMTKIGDEWKIGGDSDALFDVLFAGLSKAFDALV